MRCTIFTFIDWLPFGRQKPFVVTINLAVKWSKHMSNLPDYRLNQFTRFSMYRTSSTTRKKFFTQYYIPMIRLRVFSWTFSHCTGNQCTWSALKIRNNVCERALTWFTKRLMHTSYFLPSCLLDARKMLKAKRQPICIIPSTFCKSQRLASGDLVEVYLKYR